MKKLTSMVDQVNDRNFSEQVIQDTKKGLLKALSSIGLEELMVNYKKNRKIAGLWSIPFITLFIVGIILMIATTFIAGIAVALASVVPLIVMLVYFNKASKIKSEWLGLINGNANHTLILKTLIEGKYENVKLLDIADKRYYSIARGYRSTDIPSDANVVNDFGGLEFSINGRKISTRKLKWHWQRTYSDGKRTYTKHYYKDNFYVISVDIPERFVDFKFKMSKAGFFNNKGKELENDMFNKAFSYDHNDPINLRVFLTPFIQETFVNNFKSFSFTSTSLFAKEKDYYVFAQSLNGTPFTLNVSMITDLDKVVDSIVKDGIDDALYFLDNFSIITTIRELVK